MKAFRFFALLAMAATLTFSFNSCDKDDGDEGDNWVNTYTWYGTTYSVSELKDDGSSLTYSIKTCRDGICETTTYKYSYDKSGNINGATIIAELPSAEIAKEEYDNLLEDEDYDEFYESIVISGNIITCVAKKGVFEDYTKDMVKAEYEVEANEKGNEGGNGGDKEGLTKENYIEFLKEKSGLVLTPTSTMTISNAIDYGTYPYFVSFSTENAIADAVKIGKDLFEQTAKLGKGNYMADSDWDDDAEKWVWYTTKEFSTFEDALYANVGDTYKQYWWYYDTDTRVRLEVSMTVDSEKNYISISIDFK